MISTVIGLLWGCSTKECGWSRRGVGESITLESHLTLPLLDTQPCPQKNSRRGPPGPGTVTAHQNFDEAGPQPQARRPKYPAPGQLLHTVSPGAASVRTPLRASTRTSILVLEWIQGQGTREKFQSTVHCGLAEQDCPPQSARPSLERIDELQVRFTGGRINPRPSESIVISEISEGDGPKDKAVNLVIGNITTNSTLQ